MINLLQVLWQPLQYPFIVRGLLASLMVGTVCAVVGSYVVLRGMAFLGDALAHGILPGVAVAYLLQAHLFTGALVMGLLMALGIGFLNRQGEVKEDTAIGVIFAAFLALGVILLSRMQSYTVDLTHILFGNVLGVSSTDLWLAGLLSLLILLTVFLLYKELLLVSFDPVLAATLNLPIGFLNYLLLVLIALVIVVSIQVVGVALLVAMLVTPAATAYLLTHSLKRMMLLGALLGALASVCGLYLSFYFDVPSGAAVVLVATAFFLAVFTRARLLAR